MFLIAIYRRTQSFFPTTSIYFDRTIPLQPITVFPSFQVEASDSSIFSSTVPSQLKQSITYPSKRRSCLKPNSNQFYFKRDRRRVFIILFLFVLQRFTCIYPLMRELYYWFCPLYYRIKFDFIPHIIQITPKGNIF